MFVETLKQQKRANYVIWVFTCIVEHASGHAAWTICSQKDLKKIFFDSQNEEIIGGKKKRASLPVKAYAPLASYQNTSNIEKGLHKPSWG